MAVQRQYLIKYLVWGNHETFASIHEAASILELLSRYEWSASYIRVLSVVDVEEEKVIPTKGAAAC